MAARVQSDLEAAGLDEAEVAQALGSPEVQAVLESLEAVEDAVSDVISEAAEEPTSTTTTTTSTTTSTTTTTSTSATTTSTSTTSAPAIPSVLDRPAEVTAFGVEAVQEAASQAKIEVAIEAVEALEQSSDSFPVLHKVAGVLADSLDAVLSRCDVEDLAVAGMYFSEAILQAQRPGGARAFKLKQNKQAKKILTRGLAENLKQMARSLRRTANREKPQKTAVNRRVPQEVRPYVRDMEQRTGLQIPGNQRTFLANALRQKNFKKLNPAEKKVHGRPFKNAKLKDQLKAEWSEKTGKTWPKYTKDLRSKKTNNVLAKKGDEHQAHHIIPQQIGGPHEWWNIHPVAQPHHQGGVHGKNAPLTQMMRKVQK